MLYNPVAYLVFTLLTAVSGYDETPGLVIYRRVLLGITLVLLMTAWIADRINVRRGTSPRRTPARENISNRANLRIRKMNSEW